MNTEGESVATAPYAPQPPPAYGFKEGYGSPKMLAQLQGAPQGASFPPQQSVGVSYIAPDKIQQLELVQVPTTAQPTGVSYHLPGNVLVWPRQVMPQFYHRPPSYMGLAVCSLIMFFPMGICALIYSVNSNSAAKLGDFAMAKSASRHARNLSIGAIVLGIIVIILIVVNCVYTLHLRYY